MVINNRFKLNQRIRFKNHLPGTSVNDNVVVFEGAGCNDYSCSIDCLTPITPDNNIIENCTRRNGQSIKLSDIIK